MTRIASLTQALQWLRMARAQPRADAAQPPTAAGTPAATLSVQRPALSRLPGQLKALRASAGSLPRGKALRLFIQAALVDEFGDALLLDPAFADLVERTSAALEADGDNAALLDEALQELSELAD